MYSLVETAKENGLHPYHYLEHLLSKLPNATTNDLTDLLPWSDTLPDKCYFPQKEDASDAEKGA